MQPFTIQAACRLETEVRAWDTATGKWTQRKIAKPRLIPNPPQQFTEEQSKFLKEYAALLAEKIRLDNAERQRARVDVDPMDFLYGHYRILEGMGFGEIEEMLAVRQLTKYAWDLVDRRTANKISGEEFEDAVQRWFLFMVDKVEARKCPVAVGA